MAKRIRAEIHARFLTALIVVAVSTSALPIITPSTVIPSHDAAVVGHRAGRWSIQSKTAARRMLQYVSTIQQVRDSASTKRDFFRLFMAALRSRCGHHIFAMWFLLSFIFFISSPNPSRRLLDVYNTSTRGVALVRI